MNKIILYLTPSQLAKIRGVTLAQIFDEIDQENLPVLITDDGIRIPVIYSFN